MKRIRAVGILIKDDDILLIHRFKGKEYFTLPGGGVENGETIEEAVIREFKEEATIDIKVKKLLYHQIYNDNTEQYFYLCEYIKGEPKLPDDSPERLETWEEGEIFDPKWFKILDLQKMLLYPLEIRDLIINDYPNNFLNPVKTLEIKISDLRES